MRLASNSSIVDFSGEEERASMRLASNSSVVELLDACWERTRPGERMRLTSDRCVVCGQKNVSACTAKKQNSSVVDWTASITRQHL